MVHFPQSRGRHCQRLRRVAEVKAVAAAKADKEAAKVAKEVARELAKVLEKQVAKVVAKALLPVRHRTGVAFASLGTAVGAMARRAAWSTAAESRDVSLQNIP